MLFTFFSLGIKSQRLVLGFLLDLRLSSLLKCMNFSKSLFINESLIVLCYHFLSQFLKVFCLVIMNLGSILEINVV